MSRSKKIQFAGWEARKEKEAFTMMPISLISSEAYTSMNYSSKILYMYMKFYSYREKSFDFSFSFSKKHKIITNSRTFVSSKKELIDHGFIEYERQSKCSRLPTRFKFSDRWKSYPNIEYKTN